MRSDAFRESEAGRIARRQFIRCATSVGANYRAAQLARSKAEFIAKLQIALEEADETVYWLEVASRANLLDFDAIHDLMSEARELCAIFMSSLKTAKGIQ